MLRIVFNGYVSKDAVTNEVSGKEVVNFSVGVQNKDKEKTTTWIECSWWINGSQSKIAEWIKKGKQVIVEGTPKIDSYVGKDGQTHFVLRCTVSNIELISTGRQDGEAGSSNGGGLAGNTVVSNTPYSSSSKSDDEVPF